MRRTSRVPLVKVLHSGYALGDIRIPSLLSYKEKQGGPVAFGFTVFFLVFPRAAVSDMGPPFGMYLIALSR